MNLNPVELLDPVFNFLAALIQNYGLIFTWCLSGWLPVIAWIFSGGLRRKRPQGNSAAVVPGIIITTQPTSRPPPPIIGIEVELGRRRRNNGLSMTAFQHQQSDCARRAPKKADADTFKFTSQITSSICAVMFAKREKSGATIFRSRCSRTAICYRFYTRAIVP